MKSKISAKKNKKAQNKERHLSTNIMSFLTLTFQLVKAILDLYKTFF